MSVKEKIKRSIKWQHAVILLMLLFILFNGSLYNLIHNKQQLRKMQNREAELDKEFAVLGAELQKLQSGDVKYIEDIARSKYHMTRPGEVEFRVK